ncbi:TetR/AcrR family transcriptional regulator [Fulvivirgaceae bacterium PWU4]|uniref:Biofilm operon icaADBC HTH-type negative transcriptional regulator IcaR n=1 Tax=Chryseosolibacter histidini TaxID=2782349 RepID=A0AAP2GJI8_9BACT|nr:TetR/AcrR family transcriptional regulator [Chryseosolibacter histidini]MBT1698064.1 TetR/AcrR family transcriptional regulator [Chryseosolibacter histidini]
MGRTSLKQTRQKEIVQAFYEVSKKIGLENASLAKVADHMDINPSLVVHYFKTRDALFSGLISFILEKYNDIYQANGATYSTPKELRALIENLFSRKWNKLFDDSVFYSCYAMTYRDKKIRKAFKALHDSLRALLVDALRKAKQNQIVDISNEKVTAEVIFALVEGAYYYLGMVDSKEEYNTKLKLLKTQALSMLKIERNGQG